jgi:penicillin amidase
VPPQNGFAHLAPDLPGVPRDGGYEVVNASSFSARATGLNSFMFGGGPVRRYVGRPLGGNQIEGFNVIPGGPSGIPGDPGYTTQLGTWLTADYHRVNMSLVIPRGIEETLTPAAP